MTMSKHNLITVFVPDCAAEDVQAVRIGLHAAGFFPVFPDDINIDPKYFPGCNLENIQHKYFEDACVAVAKYGAMAVSTVLKDSTLSKELIAWCKAQDIPVHVFDEHFKINPAWKTESQNQAPTKC